MHTHHTTILACVLQCPNAEQRLHFARVYVAEWQHGGTDADALARTMADNAHKYTRASPCLWNN